MAKQTFVEDRFDNVESEPGYIGLRRLRRRRAFWLLPTIAFAGSARLGDDVHVLRLTVGTAHRRLGIGRALLADLVTHPTHRRRGIARALVAAAIAAERAERPGTRIHVAVGAGTPSESLHRSLGFVRSAAVTAALQPGPDPDGGPGAAGAHR
jgi:ribosomal protein S18 acetylase RimI-like enzyme